MQKTMRTCALVAALLIPAVASAQTTRAVSVGASGGLSLPMGDLGKGVESGYSVAGHIFLAPASMTMLSFRGDVSYDSWKGKGASAASVDANTSAMGFAGNALFTLGESNAAMRPYLLGGGGAYRFKSSAEVLGVETESTTTKPGIQIGAGANFKLSGFSTFLEAKYVNVFTEGSSTGYVPITFGVRF